MTFSIAASYTGDRCLEWAGSRTGPAFACQGNIVVGEQVVAAMSGAFTTASGDLVDRLLAALVAGDAAGGDRRGRQSAALPVVRDGGGYEGRNDRYVDVRVDDHPQAVTELARVFAVYDVRRVRQGGDRPQRRAAPGGARSRRGGAAPARRAGALLGPGHRGVLDEPTRAALAAFAGQFNLEGRLRGDEQLSEALVRELRDVTPDIA